MRSVWGAGGHSYSLSRYINDHMRYARRRPIHVHSFHCDVGAVFSTAMTSISTLFDPGADVLPNPPMRELAQTTRTTSPATLQRPSTLDGSVFQL